MPKEVKITWLDKPEAHDYPAALSYLTLLQDENTARRLVGRLKKAPPSRFKAKDIFRASGLSLLGVSNSHVNADWKENQIRGAESLRSCWFGMRPMAGW